MSMYKKVDILQNNFSQAHKKIRGSSEITIYLIKVCGNNRVITT